MDSSKLKAILIIVLAAFAALYLGVAAATAQFEAIAWIGGGLVIAVCLALGRRIWLLIPLASSLGLVLPLPGNFTTDLIANALVLGFCSVLFLMRKLPFRLQFTELEFWCLLIIACVAQAYLRNPVGLNLFGGQSVGGKPYILFAISCAVALLLSVLHVAPGDLRWWVRLSLIGALVNFGLGAIGKLFPSIGYYLGASFSTDVESANEGLAEGEASRVAFVRGISLTAANWLVSRISPLRACFHPLWMPVILFSLAAAAYSGFRSQLIIVGLHYLIGICYRSGVRGLLVAIILGSLSLTTVAFVNLIAPLPPNVQRALTFLPGTWEERYKSDAEHSTEWRVTMWKEALFTEKWIKNKWLGDGLGFSKTELDRMNTVNAIKGGRTEMSGLSSGQENMMINGGYHSGPVQTIRTIGYAGLLVVLIAFIRLGIHAHRQIQRCRNTEWYPVALFICVPIIAGAFFWVLVYGSFESAGQGILLSAAVIRLLENNLPLPAFAARRKEPFILKKHAMQPAQTA
jgi:hypothetical protein